MAVSLDVPHLSAYLSFPEASLNTVLQDPTTELVKSLLTQVALKAREHEVSQSEKLKLEVELESAVHSAQSKTRVLKSSVERAQKEAEELRRKVEAAETSKNEVQSKLQELQNSTTSNDSETSTLRARISSLETSNRDTISLLESKSTAHEQLATELSAKHQKTVELRSEVSKLEQDLQTANTAVTSAKFREQSLQQEVDSLRRTNDWLDKELKTRTDEYSKFRKEKSAVLSELQRNNEECITIIESLKRTEQTLRTRLDEVSQKADGFLTQANELRDEANRKEEMWRAELDTANRLGDLMKQSADTEKQRSQDLLEEMERFKDDTYEEVARLRSEAETQNSDREAAERRVAELEAVVERLEADVTLAQSTVNQTQPAQPQTPGLRGSRRGTPVPDGTPGSRLMSPMSGAIRGGISYTQVISDYHAAKSELDAEKRRNQKLSEAMEDMLKTLETHEPEIVEMKAEQQRLEADVLEMSTLVDNVGRERDEAKKDGKKWERQMQGLTREGELLRQQLRDISSQMKVLMVEFYNYTEGQGTFTPEERAKLESLAQGDLNNESDGLTDTDRFISQNLVTFRNITELQEQNAKLLNLTRELGQRMEGEEAQAQRSKATQNEEELQELRQQIERHNDEVSSLKTQCKSYVQERDMFRRMLTHRGQLPAEGDMAAMFGQSTSSIPPTPTRNGLNASTDQTATLKDADVQKMIKEMQSQFDLYRQQTAEEHKVKGDQLADASKKNTELRNDLSKKAGEVSLITERYEMLQGNFNMLKNENLELQKRSQSLSEKAAVQDLRTQQVTEDLVQSKGLLESMRNETANLKAEKEFWKSVEKRLQDDNQSLLADRDRLNNLNSNLQNLLNERDHSDSEVKRKLQTQVESLEAELTGTKRKLTEEVEEHKRTVQRREYESGQAQNRIDDLMTSISSAKEELASLRTNKDHLQSKVDELTIELRSAEERLEVLQQRPATTANTQGTATPAEGSMNREQELALEVSELKRDLELTQGELANAKTQVEQYKAISQSSEEELRSFSETHEQFREEMDQLVEEKENAIKSLEQNSETLRGEITALNTEMSTLRAESAQHNHKLEDQKFEYETKLTELKDQCERTEAAAKYHQEDLKAQAEIARQAQQNYENELVKHAEAAKVVQKVRGEYNELKLEVMELKTRAEAAQAQLSQNEDDWTESKERYERELTELRTRREDANAQNKVLHQQLESMNKQIADLQKSRRESGVEETDDTTDTQYDTKNLQELVRYLRREKEIVDVQLDLSSQETRRLRQQLDHTQSQLEETRLKLVQQRRTEEDSERQALNHKKLMETIEELNLNRESNSTLRLEKTQLQNTLNEKLASIEELQGKIQPLQARVVELEGLTESLEQDLRLTEETRARFEKRYHDMLNRSESVDPAEFEKVKERVTELETEQDALVQAKDELQTQVDGIPTQIKAREDALSETYQESRKKIVDQAKEQNRKQRETIKERESALTSMTQERDALQQKSQALQTELDQAKSDLATAQVAAATAATQQSEEGEVQDVNPNTGPSAAEVEDLQQKVVVAENKVSSAEARVLELESQATTTQASLEQAEKTIESLQAHLKTAEDNLQQQANQPENSSTQQTATTEEPNEAIETLREELNSAKHEAEQLRATVLAQDAAANVQVEEGSPTIQDQIKAQVEAIQLELTNRHEQRVREAEELYKSRTTNMKNILNARLAKLKTATRAEVLAEIQAEHAKEIEALNERHKSELEELKRVSASSAANGHLPTSDRKSEVVEITTQTEDITKSLTEQEMRDMLQKDAFCRRMISNNITNHVNKAKAEQAETLEGVKTKAIEDARRQATEMEAKKHAVKLNMSENKAKMLNAKWGVVEQAAKDTPEKAVGEVWTIAKDTKPAPPSAGSVANTPARPASAASGSVVPQQTPQAASTGVTITPTAAPQASNTQAVNTNATSQQTQQSQQSQPTQKPQDAVKTTAAPQENPFQQSNSGKTNPFASSTANATNGPPSQQTGLRRPSGTNSLSQSAHAPGGNAGQGQARKLPNAPLGGAKPAIGTGGGSGPQRSFSSSGLPVPGAAGRGSGIPQPGQTGIPRGGARGGFAGRGQMGRGGLQQVNTHQAQAQGQAQGPGSQSAGSPKGRPMNASAQQFVPKKRTADDSGLEASQYASGGEKKPKPGQ